MCIGAGRSANEQRQVRKMGAVANWISVFVSSVKNIRVGDILDIAIITFVFYKLMLMIRGKSAARIVRALVFLLLITWLSDVVGLNAVNFILSNTIQMGVIALLIMFQPEIRRALEKIGATSSIGRLIGKSETEANSSYEIKQVVEACSWLSRSRYGALIVFERDINLDESIKTGTVIDAAVTSELLKNLFFPNAALHDGAVIIRSGRIVAAGCMLPLTNNVNLDRDLGMRHRAGIGISEQSDAIVVIVSEERGSISVAENGMIKMNLSRDLLEKLLTMRLTDTENDKNPVKDYLRVFRRKNDGQ